MKRGRILLSLLVFILSSCYEQRYPELFPQKSEPNAITSYSALYSISLSKAERPGKTSARYGQPKIDTFAGDKYKYLFEDDMVRVLWLVNSLHISFSIQNKTDHSIKIPWDEAAFIDPKGGSHRVMHSGIKYTNRENPQAPSIIARKASLDDIVFPTDYINWKEGTRNSAGRWEEKPFFLTFDFHSKLTKGDYPTLESFEQAAKSNIGKSFQVLLPLQIEDVINDYIFTFVVESVICSQETKTF